jgi:hypothetical protein
MDLESIRVLIRVRMRDGRLPRESAPQAFGQPGNGQKCSACDEILTTDRLMMEVPANNGKIFSFHGDCYLLWLDERRGAPRS